MQTTNEIMKKCMTMVIFFAITAFQLAHTKPLIVQKTMDVYEVKQKLESFHSVVSMASVEIILWKGPSGIKIESDQNNLE